VVATRPGRGGKPSLFDLSVVLPKYLEHVQRAGPAGGGRDARARRDNAQAALNELRLQRERGEVMGRAQVVAESQAFIRAAVSVLRQVPSKMARADLIAAAAVPTVAAFVDEGLTEISRWSSMVDVIAAAGRNGGAPESTT